MATVRTRKRATRAQSLADTLRQEIRNGKYLSGARIIELDVADDAQVSQNTVREALHILEREGWVVSSARRGTFIRSFNVEEAEEVYALWAVMSKMAYGWALERHDRVDILAFLEPLLDSAREQYDAEIWFNASKTLFDFHNAIAHLSGHSQTIEITARLINHAQILDIFIEMRLGMTQVERDEVMNGYEHLFGVMKFGTPEEAQDALYEQIIQRGKPIIRWLAMNN